jgi:hypothetical protein
MRALSQYLDFGQTQSAVAPPSIPLQPVTSE